MFYANDVWYNARDSYWRGGKPLFVFDHDTLVLTNVPVPAAILDERRTQWSMRSFIENNSKLYWLVAGALKKQPRLHALVVRLGLAEVPPEMVLDAGDKVPVPAEFNVYRTNVTPEIALAWRTTEALLARMRFQVESAGGHFLAFLIPLRGDILHAGGHGARNREWRRVRLGRASGGAALRADLRGEAAAVH
jgi:hypothetical protein